MPVEQEFGKHQSFEKDGSANDLLAQGGRGKLVAVCRVWWPPGEAGRSASSSQHRIIEHRSFLWEHARKKFMRVLYESRILTRGDDHDNSNLSTAGYCESCV